jgi:hypothetical protein
MPATVTQHSCVAESHVVVPHVSVVVPVSAPESGGPTLASLIVTPPSSPMMMPPSEVVVPESREVVPPSVPGLTPPSP